MEIGTKLTIFKSKYQMLDGSEKSLVERVGDGSIIKRFDKTPIPKEATDVVCPHFLELKWATGCPFNCSWCYLKGTLRFPPRKTKPYIKDYERIGLHVESFLSDVTWCSELLNTGELADSLMGENSGNPFAPFIISLFEEQKIHKVLLLTKSNNVDNLLNLKRHDQAIISFSLNPDHVAKKWEKKAPSVTDRIDAAKRVSEAGYEVRIRIDPMIPVAGWKEKYRELVDQIFEAFVPERITIGSLRGLQSTINAAKDKSWVKYLSKKEKSNWGKKIEFNTRYFMFLNIINYLKDKYNYTDIALCKETIGIWNKLGLDYRAIKCNCLL